MKKLILLLFIPLISFGQSETENNSKVPSEIFDNIPVYPGCKGSELKKRKCMSERIAKFVERKYNTDIAADLGLTGRQRISVIFKIDTLGNITGVRARAPHRRLEKEAVRVIKLLPKMKPGIQNGKPVIVPYSLPMTFQVKENKKKKEILKPAYLDW
ncbi:MAG: hypothetical protein CND26_01685 [Bacteroidetes bacterium MED-G13]|nr:MAG: hypothetical protein CND26_01685 [Bacteroidetes bacterium MED-G13]